MAVMLRVACLRKVFGLALIWRLLTCGWCGSVGVRCPTRPLRLMPLILLATARGAPSLASRRSGRSSTSRLPMIGPMIWHRHYIPADLLSRPGNGGLHVRSDHSAL
jgi:hypothetical protein